MLAACADDATSPPETVTIAKGENEACPVGAVSFPTKLPDAATPALGALPGAFDVTPSGDAAYSIPLALPPTPTVLPFPLSLEYRASGGDSFLGTGFSLAGLSVISRCPRTFARDLEVRAVQYDDTDNFCLDGKRLENVGVDTYRTYPDTFVRIRANRNADKEIESFTLRAPSGVHYTYGGTDHGRVLAYSDKLVNTGWLLDKISTDTTPLGVDIDYTNIKDQTLGYTTEVVPASATYGEAQIQFAYDSKAPEDVRESWNHGMRMTRSLQLRHIAMGTLGGELTARKYVFGYDAGKRTRRTNLVSVKQCDASNACQPPTTFTYDSTPLGRNELSWTDTQGVIPPPVAAQATVMAMDVTGDGLDDLVTADTTPTPSATTVWSIARNIGDGKFAAPVVALTEPMRQTTAVSADSVILDRGTAIDYNGDGLLDILLHDVDGQFANWQVLLSAFGSTSFTRFDTGIARPFASTIPKGLVGIDGSVHLADFDGDGVSDLVQCKSAGNSQWTWTVNTWRGPPVYAAGFDPFALVIENSEFNSHAFTLRGYPCDTPVIPLDVDHDGRMDLLVREVLFADGTNPTQYGSKLFAIGRHGTWSSFEVTDPKLPAPTGQLAFADINGDGLLDALSTPAVPNTNFDVRINQGGTFGPATNALPSSQMVVDVSLNLAAPTDVDGDGRQDVIVPIKTSGSFVQWKVLHARNDGQAIAGAPLEVWSPGFPTDLEFQIDQEPTLSHPLAPRVADVDGNGAHDVLLFTGGKLHAFKSKAFEEDMLATITTGSNARAPGDAKFVPDVSISYGHLVDRFITDGGASAPEKYLYLSRSDKTNTCEYPRRCAVGARRVVAKYETNNGADVKHVFDLHYRDGRVHLRGWGWLGFGTQILLDDANKATKTTTFENRTPAAIFGDYPLAERAASVVTTVRAKATDPNPNRIDSFRIDITREMEVINTSTGLQYFVAPTATREQTLQDGVIVSDARTSTTYDELGNPRNSVSWVEGVDETTTIERDYWNDQSNWLLRRPKHVVRCSTTGGGAQCKTLDVDYDALGRPVTQRSSADGGAGVTVTYTYDDKGNPNTAAVSDATGTTRKSCMTFDSTGTFPTAMIDGLGHKRFYQYDARFGTLSTEIDPNGLATQWATDRLGRVTQERRPDGTQTTILRSQIVDPIRGKATQVKTMATGAPTTTVQFDQRDRPVIEWTDNLHPYCTGPCLIVPRLVHYTEYETLTDEVRRESMPVDETLPLTTFWNSYLRDATGRILKSDTYWAGGTMKFGYDKLVTTVTTPGNIVKTITTDPGGRTVAIKDPSGTSTFEYGPFGRLAKSTSSAGEVSRYSYDGFGRITSATEPNRGTTTRTFDGFGNLVETTDAMGRTMKWTYDTGGRPLTRTDNDGLATWTWDTAPGAGIGHIAALDAPAGKRSYSYTAVGQLASDTLTIGSESFVTTRTYDTAARLATIAYPLAPGLPGAVVAKREYDSAGHLVRVADATTNANYWTITAKDAYGHPTEELLGNGAKTAIGYVLDKNRVSSIKTTLGASTLQDLTYVWTDRLDLASRADGLQHKTESFTYDPLDRLTCAKFDASPTCALSVAYAANGNIASKSDVGSYVYAADHPHAVRSIASKTYDYDLVGNQIKRPDATLTYTANDQVRSIVPTAGASVTYDYDANGKRIRRTIGTETAIYAGLYERTTKASGVDHLYSITNNDHVVALVTRHAGLADTTTFVHVDHLGSPDVLTNKTGVVIQRLSYDAFGQRRNPAWGQSYTPATSAVPMSYTGQHEDVLDLVDMKGRTYDPKLGRFLQADLISGSPLASQSNSYSYVGNNPLVFTDPSGYTAVLHQTTQTTTVSVPSSAPSTDPSPTINASLEQSAPAPAHDTRNAGENTANDTASTGTTSTVSFDVWDVVDTGLHLALESGPWAGMSVEPLPTVGDAIGQSIGSLGSIGSHGIHKSKDTPDSEFVGPPLLMDDDDTLPKWCAPLAIFAIGVGGAEIMADIIVEMMVESLVEAGFDYLEDWVLDVGKDLLKRYLNIDDFELPDVVEHLLRRFIQFGTVSKIPKDKVDYGPKRRGGAPVGNDKKPIELHHLDQKNDYSPLAELIRRDHRGKGAYKRNHGNTGQQGSSIMRKDFDHWTGKYWEHQFDTGQFDGLDDCPPMLNLR